MSRDSLSNIAYNTIVSKIINCEYAPGSIITEEQLVNTLCISRTPIRSALIRLQGEHLLQVLPKKGILIADITLEDIQNLFDLRDLIEPYAVEKFSRNFGKDRLLYYLELFSRPCTGDDLSAFFENDVQFHTDIVAASKNSLMIGFYGTLQMQLSRITVLTGSPERVAYSNQEHLQIILALLRDDPSTASTALRAHLVGGRETIYNAVLARMRGKR